MPVMVYVNNFGILLISYIISNVAMSTVPQPYLMTNQIRDCLVLMVIYQRFRRHPFITPCRDLQYNNKKMDNAGYNEPVWSC